MQRYERGDTMRITANFYDADGELVDPTTPTCVVYKPDGSLKESTLMTQSATGIYYADVTTDLADDLGYWKVKCYGLYGTKRILNSEKVLVEEVN